MFDINWISFSLGFIAMLTLINAYQLFSAYINRKKAKAELKDIRESFQKKLAQFRIESSNIENYLGVK
ncbi:hypothetical protein HZC34_01905 [Candidatus Saganbacteria bacterium]|nr:hypothetical protein [Candidatus Saganbacteria bacterium]